MDTNRFRARPGEKVNLLKLGEGPFPLPIGQPKEDVHREFIVTKGDLKLPPLYAVLGRVTGGMDVVQKIGKLGDLATELPTKRVVIKHAVLAER